jgi:hypothetical protein
MPSEKGGGMLLAKDAALWAKSTRGAGAEGPSALSARQVLALSVEDAVADSKADFGCREPAAVSTFPSSVRLDVDMFACFGAEPSLEFTPALASVPMVSSRSP